MAERIRAMIRKSRMVDMIRGDTHVHVQCRDPDPLKEPGSPHTALNHGLR
jgi:hypothetical protein